MALTEFQVREFVLEDDASVEESVLDDIVRGGHLVFCKRYLRQVVLTVMGVVGQRVGSSILSRNTVSTETVSGQAGQAVEAFLAFRVGCQVDHRLVQSAPVVHILTASPLAFEGLLTLVYCRGVIEVPLSVTLLRRVGGSRLSGCVTVITGSTAFLECLFHFLLQGFVALFFLLLLKGINHAVNSL